MENNFSFVMPAELEKSSDGEWRVRGLASTEKPDRQGETLIQKGIDLTPIQQGQGYLNFDHLSGPENLVGTIDNYRQSQEGLYVEGRLFKEHDKAKAIHQIMSSLGKSDKGRIGLSVEGRVLERDAKNPKIIKKCQIKNVAITFSPVNTDTYADLVKSMGSDAVDFASDGTHTSANPEAKVFTASEVVALMSKALGVSANVAEKAPTEKEGGDALTQESKSKKTIKVNEPLMKDPVEKGGPGSGRKKTLQVKLGNEWHHVFARNETEKDPITTKDKSKAVPDHGLEYFKQNFANHEFRVHEGDDTVSKSLKPMSKELFKSAMLNIMDRIQVLYPAIPKEVLWTHLKDRLNKKFPEIESF